MAITEEESHAIQKQGANARALGLSEFDNPFYKSEAMPRLSGESAEVWNAKQEAWNLGWHVENAMHISPVTQLVAFLAGDSQDKRDGV